MRTDEHNGLCEMVAAEIMKDSPRGWSHRCLKMYLDFIFTFVGTMPPPGAVGAALYFLCDINPQAARNSNEMIRHFARVSAFIASAGGVADAAELVGEKYWLEGGTQCEEVYATVRLLEATLIAASLPQPPHQILSP